MKNEFSCITIEWDYDFNLFKYQCREGKNKFNLDESDLSEIHKRQETAKLNVLALKEKAIN